jgi:hypothetical protein
VTTVNLTVLSSTVVLTMTPVPDSLLYQSEVCVQGNIAGSDNTVAVNGMVATMGDGGSWSADHVPVSPGGVATFRLVATNPSQLPVEMTINQDKPPVVYVARYAMSYAMSMSGYTNDLQTPKVETLARNWELCHGGREDYVGLKQYAGWHETTWETTWPADGWLPLLAGNHQEWSDSNRLTPVEVAAFTAPIEHGAVSGEVAWIGGGECGTVHYSRQGESELKMFTGGKARAGQQKLYSLPGVLKLGRYQWALEGGQLFEDTDVPGEATIWGDMGRADANFTAWRLYKRGQTVVVTPRTADPTLTLAALAAGSGPGIGALNPTVAVVGAPREYSPQILFRGVNVSDKTNTVWVGEQIQLQCTLSGSEPPPITNVEWTILGSVVAGFAVRDLAYTNDDGEALTAPRGIGHVVPLVNTNVNPITFYWVDGSPIVSASINASISGSEFQTRTCFEVRKPDAIWFGITNGPIQITNESLVYGISKFDPSAGMHFVYANLELNGYTNSFAMSSLQIISSMLIEYVGENAATNQVRVAVTPVLTGVALDTVYPFISWGMAYSGVHYDSPGCAAAAGIDQLDSTDPIVYLRSANLSGTYQHYLMFQPAEPSIPVAIRRIDWSLSMAGDNAHNTNHLDTLVTGSCGVTLQNNLPVLTNPSWSNYFSGFQFHHTVNPQ